MSSSKESRVVLLGPQRFNPAVREAVHSVAPGGSLAVVTAGWQEREAEDRELEEHVQCPVVDLMLYHRADDVFLRDHDLAAALRERQEELRQLQDMYRIRLGHALDALRELMLRAESGPLIDEQRGDTLRAVRMLDRQHLRKLRHHHAEFDRRFHPHRRAAVTRHRTQIARVLDRVAGVCVAGGHVAVLLNRLRLFDLGGMLSGRPVIAWSGGAMVVSERVVLFHDSPPHGAGNAELFDAGLGLCRGVVALPHARRRLDLADRTRVAVFARRFAPAVCVILEDQARLEWDGVGLRVAPATLRMAETGGITSMDGPRVDPH